MFELYARHETCGQDRLRLPFPASLLVNNLGLTLQNNRMNVFLTTSMHVRVAVTPPPRNHMPVDAPKSNQPANHLSPEIILKIPFVQF